MHDVLDYGLVLLIVRERQKLEVRLRAVPWIRRAGGCVCGPAPIKNGVVRLRTLPRTQQGVRFGRHASGAESLQGSRSMSWGSCRLC